MYNYYVLPLPGETIEECSAIARMQDGIFERFIIKNKSWQEDVELFQIYTGNIECETIDRRTAESIIKRLEQST